MRHELQKEEVKALDFVTFKEQFKDIKKALNGKGIEDIILRF